MPTPQEYAQRATSNTDFAATPLPHEWAITAYYYAALHYIYCYVKHSAGIDLSDHQSTKKTINPSLHNPLVTNHVYSSYIKLEVLSREARYLKSPKLPGTTVFVGESDTIQAENLFRDIQAFALSKIPAEVFSETTVPEPV